MLICEVFGFDDSQGPNTAFQSRVRLCVCMCVDLHEVSSKQLHSTGGFVPPR